MAKVNIDSMFQPIEFTLDGKEYKIEKVSPELVDRISKVDKADPIRGVVNQFSELTGIPVDEAQKIDLRKIRAVLELVMKSISPQGEEKNA